MIYLIVLVAIFICISSIFFKELRKLAAAILTTVAFCVVGIWALFEIFNH
jgi:hypothetical protein